MYTAQKQTAQFALMQLGFGQPEREKAIAHVIKTGEIYQPILEKWASNAKVVSSVRSHKRGD